MGTVASTNEQWTIDNGQLLRNVEKLKVMLRRAQVTRAQVHKWGKHKKQIPDGSFAEKLRMTECSEQ